MFYRVWEASIGLNPDAGDVETFDAIDASYAAEALAERRDKDNNYRIAGGGECEVFVALDNDPDPPGRFVVYGDFDPYYHASKVEDAK